MKRGKGTKAIAIAEASGFPVPAHVENASPHEVIADLQHRNKQRCAVLGGGEIYALFLASRLLDELWITVEPQIFGAGKPFVPFQVSVQLSLKECLHLSEDTLLLKYVVQK